jgi:hypothetical protein
METGTIFEYDKKTKSYETHMIWKNHNRACELSEAKHDTNIISNHVRFHYTT